VLQILVTGSHMAPRLNRFSYSCRGCPHVRLTLHSCTPVVTTRHVGRTALITEELVGRILCLTEARWQNGGSGFSGCRPGAKRSKRGYSSPDSNSYSPFRSARHSTRPQLVLLFLISTTYVRTRGPPAMRPNDESPPMDPTA